MLCGHQSTMEKLRSSLDCDQAKFTYSTYNNTMTCISIEKITATLVVVKESNLKAFMLEQ